MIKNDIPIVARLGTQVIPSSLSVVTIITVVNPLKLLYIVSAKTDEPRSTGPRRARRAYLSDLLYPADVLTVVDSPKRVVAQNLTTFTGGAGART